MEKDIDIYRNEISKLRNELFNTRVTVLNLMSDEVFLVLNSFRNCKNIEELKNWREESIEKLIELSQVKSAQEVGEAGSGTPRANCPLCGGSAQKIYGAEGFAFPKGLRRHLEGSNNAKECAVFNVIRKLSALD